MSSFPFVSQKSFPGAGTDGRVGSASTPSLASLQTNQGESRPFSSVWQSLNRDSDSGNKSSGIADDSGSKNGSGEKADSRSESGDSSSRRLSHVGLGSRLMQTAAGGGLGVRPEHSQKVPADGDNNLGSRHLQAAEGEKPYVTLSVAPQTDEGDTSVLERVVIPSADGEDIIEEEVFLTKGQTGGGAPGQGSTAQHAFGAGSMDGSDEDEANHWAGSANEAVTNRSVSQQETEGEKAVSWPGATTGLDFGNDVSKKDFLGSSAGIQVDGPEHESGDTGFSAGAELSAGDGDASEKAKSGSGYGLHVDSETEYTGVEPASPEHGTTEAVGGGAERVPESGKADEPAKDSGDAGTAVKDDENSLGASDSDAADAGDTDEQSSETDGVPQPGYDEENAAAETEIPYGSGEDNEGHSAGLAPGAGNNPGTGHLSGNDKHSEPESGSNRNHSGGLTGDKNSGSGKGSGTSNEPEGKNGHNPGYGTSSKTGFAADSGRNYGADASKESGKGVTGESEKDSSTDSDKDSKTGSDVSSRDKDSVKKESGRATENHKPESERRETDTSRTNANGIGRSDGQAADRQTTPVGTGTQQENRTGERAQATFLGERAMKPDSVSGSGSSGSTDSMGDRIAASADNADRNSKGVQESLRFASMTREIARRLEQAARAESTGNVQEQPPKGERAALETNRTSEAPAAAVDAADLRSGKTAGREDAHVTGIRSARYEAHINAFTERVTSSETIRVPVISGSSGEVTQTQSVSALQPVSSVVFGEMSSTDEEDFEWKKYVMDVDTSDSAEEEKRDSAASASRMGQIPIMNAEIRREVIPALTRFVQTARESGSSNSGSWQNHRFTMDDGSNIRISVREVDGVLQLKLGSSASELGRMLQHHYQELRDHLQKECDIEIELQLDNRGMDEFAGFFGDSQSDEGRQEHNPASGSDAKPMQVEKVAPQSIRNFGYNQMEWTA
ncbi:hypothetical protein QA596_04635 [Balneolales bacterium ANBcel1]|nr:hypothetical protein [Balneolales bacterium ANBcel1]